MGSSDKRAACRGTFQQISSFSRTSRPAFVVGGSQIYAMALPIADRMYLTVVHALVEGDTVFPAFGEDEWVCVRDVHHAADDRHA